MFDVTNIEDKSHPYFNRESDVVLDLIENENFSSNVNRSVNFRNLFVR